MANEQAFLSQARTWDAFYNEPRIADFRRRLYLAAFGDEYPEEAATDGYVTRSELRAMADALCVSPGQRIADLGCGRGGPGQWIAATTRTALVGVDFSEVAVEHARARARSSALGASVLSKTASFDATGFDAASIDGVISIDVIWAIPDKRAGFAEAARILKPVGGSSSSIGSATSRRQAILRR
jgi:ubiquinone/menaquinone biosynthesis C-methylase UbiE